MTPWQPRRPLKTPGAPLQRRLCRGEASKREEGEARTVTLRGLGGSLCSVAAQASWSAGRLKKALGQALGLRASGLRLLAGTRLLDDDDIIGTASFDTGVTLVKRPPLQAEFLELMLAQGMELEKLAQAFREAPAEVRADRDVALALVRLRGRFLADLPATLQGDPKVVLTAVRNDPSSLPSASDALRGDRAFVLAAALKMPRLLAYAEAYQADRDFVMAVMEGEDRVELLLSNPRAATDRARAVLSYAAPSLQRDLELLGLAGYASVASRHSHGARSRSRSRPRSRSSFRQRGRE